MAEEEILIKQYEKLMSMYDLHHKRWNDHWRTYLTILAILTAILTAILKDGTINGYECIIKLFISIIACIICISGWISLNRIRNDMNLAFFHLRKIEDEFEKKDLNYIPIFHNGLQFFKTGVIENLKFENNFVRKVKLINLVFISFISFFILFILIMIFG